MGGYLLGISDLLLLVQAFQGFILLIHSVLLPETSASASRLLFWGIHTNPECNSAESTALGARLCKTAALQRGAGVQLAEPKASGERCFRKGNAACSPRSLGLTERRAKGKETS